MIARFYRVVELEPVTPLPVDCRATIVLPTTPDDSTFGRQERYVVNTARTFRIGRLRCACWSETECRSNQLLLEFTAPVRRSDLLRYVRLNSQSLLLASQPDTSKAWTLTVPLNPRTRYMVEVDSAMRDIYGRALEGDTQTSATTADYLPSLTFARGVITVPRSGPATFPVRSVNVKTARSITYVVPDSLRARMLATPYVLGGVRAWFPRVRPETTIVALNSTLNATSTTQVPLPAAALRPRPPDGHDDRRGSNSTPDVVAGSAARGALTLAWPEDRFRFEVR